MAYEFERTLRRLTTGEDLHYGDWKSRSTAGAQREQRRRWGETDDEGRRT